MGIQLWIEDNHEYCVAHDLIEHDTFECQCVDWEATTNCPVCKGAGSITREVHPWTAYYSYGTWGDILQVIGLSAQDVVSGVD